MMKVLIVEDEPPIRKWIERVIKNTDGFDVVEGNAGNGQEALMICRREQPDIVFTDIKMPVMDGIMLIKRLKEDFPGVVCVVLSNYGEYAMVRETLRDGAFDYLLKLEMQEEDIVTVLRHLEQMILKRREEQKDAYERSLKELLRTKPSAKENLKRLNGTIGMKLVGKQMAVLAVRRSGEGEMKISELSKDGWLVCEFPEYVCLVMCRDIPLSNKEFQEEVKEKIYFIKTVLGERVDCGCGPCLIYKEQKALYDSYRQAVYRMEEAAFYRPGIGYLLEKDKQALTEWDQMKTGLHRDIVRYPFGSSMEMLMERMRFMVEKLDGLYGLPQKVLKKDLVEIMVALISKIQFCVREEAKPDPEELKEFQTSIWEAENVVSLTSYLKKLTERAGRYCSIPENASEPVRKALRYMLENYQNEITRSEVAGYVHLNAEYFSELFKRETGRGFLEYLTGLRMEYACYLLSETEKQVTEVAEKVGYHDAAHFSRTFVKWKGAAPGEYRRACRRKMDWQPPNMDREVTVGDDREHRV